MFAILVSLTMLMNAPEDKKDSPPAKKELFAKETWYKETDGKEEEFIGKLQFTPRKEGVVGFGRFNPYKLDLGEKLGIRQVHVRGQDKIMAEYDGKKVKIIGKAVDMEVEGKKYREIWPARVELIDVKEEGKK